MDDKDVYGVFCMCFFQVIMENMLRISLVVSQLSSFPVKVGINGNPIKFRSENVLTNSK